MKYMINNVAVRIVMGMVRKLEDSRFTCTEVVGGHGKDG